MAGISGLTAHNVRGVREARQRAVSLRHAHQRDGLIHPPSGPRDARPLRLVTVGDSVMDGDGIEDPSLTLPVRIASALAARTARSVDLVQLGRTGARTDDVLTDQLPQLPALLPEVVVLSVGVNDGLGGRRLAAIRTDHRRIALVLSQTVPSARVVLLGAPDLRHAPALPAPVRQVVGLLTGRVGRRQARWLTGTEVRVVEVGTPTSDFGPDGFHPGPTATPVLAGWVVDAVLR